MSKKERTFLCPVCGTKVYESDNFYHRDGICKNTQIEKDVTVGLQAQFKKLKK